MKNVIQSMTEIANELDNRGLGKAADKIDRLAKQVAVVKYAQFVGVQGYWIRNTRCWQNCYRQKRVKNANKSSQEVWAECHKEYLESINNDSSGWEKYAEEASSQVKKFASIEKASELIKMENEEFSNRLASKLENGVPVGFAVYEASEEGANKYASQMMEKAERTIKIANKLAEGGYKDIAVKLNDVAIDLVKEAQFSGGFWNKAKEMGRAVGNFFTGGGDVGTKMNWLNNLQKEVVDKLYALRKDRNGQVFNALQQTVNKKLPAMKNMFGKDPNAQSLLNAAGQFATQIQVGSRGQVANNLLKAIGEYQRSLQQQAKAPQSQQSPQAPQGPQAGPQAQQTNQPQQAQPQQLNELVKLITDFLVKNGWTQQQAQQKAQEKAQEPDTQQQLNSGAAPAQVAQQQAKEVSQEQASAPSASPASPSPVSPQTQLGSGTVKSYFDAKNPNRQQIVDLLNSKLGGKFKVASKIVKVAQEQPDFAGAAQQQVAPPTLKPVANQPIAGQPQAAQSQGATGQFTADPTIEKHMDVLAKQLLSMSEEERNKYLSEVGLKAEGAAQTPDAQQAQAGQPQQEQAQDAASAISSGIKSMKSTLAQLASKVDPNQLRQEVVNAIKAEGWQDENVAANLANWLIGDAGKQAQAANNKQNIKTSKAYFSI